LFDGKEDPLPWLMLTVNSYIKVHLDLQVDKSPVIVKRPFFPRVVNPRYRIRGKMCDAKVDLVKPSNFDKRETLMHLGKRHETNLIY
jgi:hypothetical protein